MNCQGQISHKKTSVELRGLPTANHQRDLVPAVA